MCPWPPKHNKTVCCPLLLSVVVLHKVFPCASGANTLPAWAPSFFALADGLFSRCAKSRNPGEIFFADYCFPIISPVSQDFWI